MLDIAALNEYIRGHHEWLLIREAGKTFPIKSDELEILETGEKAYFGFLDDSGFHSWRLNSFSHHGGELKIDVAGAFGKKRETMRLVPRTAARQLIEEVQLARLAKANEIAGYIAGFFPDAKLGRVSLNEDNGRFAHIHLTTPEKRAMAAIADVTASLTIEAVFSTAILWLEKLGGRKKHPVNELLMIFESKQAKNAQKLHALLTGFWRRKLHIIEIDRKNEPARLVALTKRSVGELWRERPRKFIRPEGPTQSLIAQRIAEIAPGKIDAAYTKHGETLGFMGLPFVRTRKMMGVEKAWFGISRPRKILTDSTWDELVGLIELMKAYRTANPQNKRHELYRVAPEAWLESILRRNIKLLDANIILSPIYHQFRSLNDKIDLLALRKDGRLVIVELKTNPDRASVFQAVDYWRKIELQRRRGMLDDADLFDGRKILDKPALIYLAAPAWSFHRDFEFFARCILPDIELWRFELHENWRQDVKVVARRCYSQGDGPQIGRAASGQES